MMPKVMFSQPMKAGDSTLMMLLSMNLLLLVFFMLLNSMATYGAKHAQEVLAEVREGYDRQGKKAEHGDAQAAVGEAQLAWRSGVVQRMHGVVQNNLQLQVPAQMGNASKVEIDLPLDALFDPAGRLARPEVLRNLVAAAGPESQVSWQLRGDLQDARLMMAMNALLEETGRAEAMQASENTVRVSVLPGEATEAARGVQIQRVGEEAGGRVQGVDEVGE